MFDDKCSLGVDERADGVVEVALLLPEVQMAALKDAADCRGLTVAQLLRRLIREVTDDGFQAAAIF